MIDISLKFKIMRSKNNDTQRVASLGLATRFMTYASFFILDKLLLEKHN